LVLHRQALLVSLLKIVICRTICLWLAEVVVDWLSVVVAVQEDF
jgi:hypothetical protein